jgi:hypothetical protein
MASDPVEERVLRRIPVEVAGLAAVLAVPAGLLFDPVTGAVFFGGGTLAALSFLSLKSSLGKVLGRAAAGGAGGSAGTPAEAGGAVGAPAKGRALRSGLALYALRMALILAAFFLIMLAYPRKVLAFAAGFSTILPVFIVEAATTLARVKSDKP